MKNLKRCYRGKVLILFSLCLMLLLLVACGNGDDLPAAEEYNLEIEVIGQGEVNPSAGVHTYEEGNIYLTVNPNLGWEFKEWSGDNGGEVVTVDADAGNYLIQMDGDKKITAVFEEVILNDPVDLTINIEGQGEVTPSETRVERGTKIFVTVTPDEGYVFKEWQGPDADNMVSVQGEEDKWEILMDDNKEVTAVFDFDGSYPIVRINSNINSNTTWEGNTIYVIERSISVNAILTIEPGAIIKFEDGRSMQVLGEGILKAEGITSYPIVFTSIKDDAHGGDTNGDRGFNNPEPGDWYMVHIRGGAAIFDYCEFYYGGSGGSFGDSTLRIDGTTTVKNSTFAYNRGDTHGALDAHSGATIENNIFL